MELRTFFIDRHYLDVSMAGLQYYFQREIFSSERQMCLALSETNGEEDPESWKVYLHIVLPKVNKRESQKQSAKSFQVTS
jgi:hypothetical protein